MYERIELRQKFAEFYASFSQSRNGLGKVLGGIVCIVVALAGTFIGAGMFTSVLTIALTLLWLVGKEIIRKRVYFQQGEAGEVWTEFQRREHLFATGFVSVIAFGAAVWVFVNSQPLTLPNAIYIFVALSMPFITWRFLRAPLEFVVGVFLISACAVTAAGGAYSLILPDWSFDSIMIGLSVWLPLIGSFVLIVFGIREHRQFLSIMQAIE